MSYFFLSYAHSGPPADDIRPDADLSVSRFFRHLEREVGARAVRPPAKIGFLDREIEPGADMKARLSEALSLAEVFVPLYSPGYFLNPWPFREQQVFEGRLKASGVPAAQRHILPVLWTPFPSADRPPEIAQILKSGPSVPEYHDNGLRALCLIEAESFSRPYEQVVSWLAAEIVRLAEESPLGYSAAPELDAVPGRLRPASTFVIAFLGAARLAGLAEHAAAMIERLGFAPRVVPFEQAGDDLARSPALVLTDPAGDWELESALLLRDIPEWVIPFVVQGPHGMDELTGVLPTLVARARRTYLRLGRVFPPPGSFPRPPRLREGGLSGTDESDQDESDQDD